MTVKEFGGYIANTLGLVILASLAIACASFALLMLHIIILELQ